MHGILAGLPTLFLFVIYPGFATVSEDSPNLTSRSLVLRIAQEAVDLCMHTLKEALVKNGMFDWINHRDQRLGINDWGS